MATFAQFFKLTAILPDGTLLTDGDLYHYAAGTSTDKDVYSDRAKSATLAQPLPSDGNGVFVFYGDGLYKLVLKDADGATLYTWDNVAIVDNDPRGEGDAIASAATLVLGTDGDIFHVTGTTTITAISGSQSVVTLIFDDILTLTHSASLVLNGAVDFVTASGTVKQFLNDGGGVWREIALSLDTVVVDVKVKKDTPRVRWLGTEGSAQEYSVVESGGDIFIQRNDGSEGTPSWTTIAQYDNSASDWILTGNLQVTGTGAFTDNLTGAFQSTLIQGTTAGDNYTHEGTATISVNQNLSGVHYYTSLTINTGVTVTLPASSGRLVIIARESITLAGTAKIDAAGAGAPTNSAASGAGATGGSGTDQPGGGGGGAASSVGGAGGAIVHDGSAPSWVTTQRVSGGAGGGTTSDGSAGSTVATTPSVIDWFHAFGGAAGGAGGVDTTTSGTNGNGGAGGGTVILIAPTITLGSGSEIDTSGADGGNASDTPAIGGGGGGGAGNIYMVCRSGHLTNSGCTFTQTGGAGSSNGNTTGDGAAGGTGQLYRFLM